MFDFGVARLALIGLCAAWVFAPLGSRAANEPSVVPVIISVTGPFALIGTPRRNSPFSIR